MKALLITISVILFVSAVGMARASTADPAPVVFVHGIKGSFLVAGDQSVRWLTAWQALGLGSSSLALPLEWENSSVQKRDGLRPAGVMDEITLIPHLLRFKIYGPFLRGISQPFYPFAYDWRRDNLETLTALEQYLEGIRAAHANRAIVLVCHSMGGLLGWVVVSRHPDWFSSVFFAGVPFAGGIGFLPDLSVGTSNGLNRRILDPKTLASFPSVYSLFPIQKSPNSGAEPDYFSVDTWSSKRIGVFQPFGTSPEQAALFLRTALERAKAFRRLLVANTVSYLPYPPYPPLHVIVGNQIPTLERVVFGADHSIDFESAQKCPGDGRVCEKDAMPPAGPPRTVHLTPSSHEALLNGKDMIDLIESSR